MRKRKLLLVFFGVTFGHIGLAFAQDTGEAFKLNVPPVVEQMGHHSGLTPQVDAFIGLTPQVDAFIKKRGMQGNIQFPTAGGNNP